METGGRNLDELSVDEFLAYEHRFEEFFGTEYGTAHDRTVEIGRVWDHYKEVD